MARFFPIHLLKRLRSRLKRSRIAGFTLLEVLVSMFIAGIIMIGLLTLSARITDANQRDAGRSQIQQDMQLAMDYIAEDLREAVFVYNGDCLQGTGTAPNVNNITQFCPGIISAIPAGMSSSTRKPVLAFWRTEPLPDALSTLCGNHAATLDDVDPADNKTPTDPLTIKGVPCISGTSYSLVVYALDTDTTGSLWKGKARLIRYRLGQFKDGATSETDQSTGYANPLQQAEYTFQQWPYAIAQNAVVDRRTAATAVGGAAQPGVPSLAENPPQVLVDYVDNGVAPTTANDPDAQTFQGPDCTEFVTPPSAASSSSTASPGITAAQALTPIDPTPPAAGADKKRGSFYACVRGGGIGATTGENQDVQVVLIGSVAGYNGGFSKDADRDSDNRLSPVQTRVLIRGIVKKS